VRRVIDKRNESNIRKREGRKNFKCE
jgi:hypothetical protein